MKIFEPNYELLNRRIWNLIRFRIILYLIILLIFSPLGFWAILFPVFIILVTFIRGYNLNKKFIKKIEIDESNNNLKIVIVNGNKEIIIENNYLISECKIKITEIGNKISILYRLEIYLKDKNSKIGGQFLVAKQASVGNWTLQTFIEILRLVKNFNNEEVHVEWLEKRLKDGAY
jgi:hypothetical protein